MLVRAKPIRRCGLRAKTREGESTRVCRIHEVPACHPWRSWSHMKAVKRAVTSTGDSGLRIRIQRSAISTTTNFAA